MLGRVVLSNPTVHLKVAEIVVILYEASSTGQRFM